MAIDMTQVMSSDHALNGKFAEVFCTINGRRYHLLSCRNFEGTVNISTNEVPRLGAVVTGHKAVAAEISFTMTIYKVTEMFDDLVEQFIKTANMPRFDIQVSNDDPAAGDIGRSTKVFNNCTLDGDVLQAMVNAEGDFIEQEISGFAEDYTRPEKFINPNYM
jgi:hypothetical protein